MRVSVEPAHGLMELLGRPQDRFLAVHVAGTKGKGSVAALIGQGLYRAGLRVGTYASPHVERVTERVRWPGETPGDIADDDLAEALEAALGALDGARKTNASATATAEATWFDVLSAAAFHAFATRGVDVGVVECGLGGRLDSTNVIEAPVCVITNIELEHTAILGDTRTAIAREKAGIIAPESSVIMGLSQSDPAGLTIVEFAREQGARIHSVAVDESGERSIAQTNRALATAALDEFGRLFAARFPGHRVPQDQVWGQWALDAEACAAACLPGRLERRWIGETPVILDGAHTLESLQAVLDTLDADSILPPKRVSVFGTGGEKNAAGLLKTLGPRTDSLLCTSVGPGPYRAPEELRSIAQELDLDLDAVAIDAPRAALDEALRLAASDGHVLVTGSLHLIGAVRRFTRADPPNG